MKRSMLLVLAGFGLASMLFALVAFVGEESDGLSNQDKYIIVSMERWPKSTKIWISASEEEESRSVVTDNINIECAKVLEELNSKGFELITSSHYVAAQGAPQYFQYVLKSKN